MIIFKTMKYQKNIFFSYSIYYNKNYSPEKIEISLKFERKNIYFPKLHLITIVISAITEKKNTSNIIFNKLYKDEKPLYCLKRLITALFIFSKPTFNESGT